MAIYEITSDSLKPIPPTTFEDSKLAERGDLQRLLRDNIQAVSPDTLIIAEEFSDWDDSRRRIDLLGIDSKANLVVIELKRTQDGGHMELQAIRYAAMVAILTFDKIVDVYGNYLLSRGNNDNPRAMLLQFLGWENPDEESFADDVRIVLVSAEFGKELTTTVMWLNDRNLDIRCIRMVPYQDGSRILLDVQQVLPLPEAEEYQVKLREKEQIERKGRAERHGVRKDFWMKLLEIAKVKTKLHANVSPGEYNYIPASCGIRGLSFNYNISQYDNFVELYIDRGLNAEAETKEIFDFLYANKGLIDSDFGEPLTWRRMNDKRACRIHAESDGGYKADQLQWPQIHEKMIDTMIRLEKALRPYLDQLRSITDRNRQAAQ